MYSVASNRDGSKFFAVGERSQGEVQRYAGESKSFQRFLDGISAEGFDFSRDGEWMVYVSFPEGTLWRSHADGRGRVQLTSPPLVADHPRWSPDASRITFTGQLAGKPLNVYVVNADGSNLQPVPGSEWRIAPSWSADGNSLAFVTDAKRRDLVLYNLKTRATTTLTRGEVFFPVWSPDGNHIAAAVPQPPRLGILDLKTGRWRYLDVGSSVPNSWAWSRDARYLYLDFALTKNPSVQRIRIPDGHREKIADLTNVTRSNGNFNIWFGLDAQNSPMILRDLSSQQIYALEMEP
jgi:sugar lactone lactonase YvrE